MGHVAEQERRGIEILRAGGVIVFPTDTVYGLGADAFNAEAVNRVYAIKQRPRHLPFPVLVADVAQLALLTEQVGGIVAFLAERFWPGGLTLVVRKSATLPAHLSSDTGVAVRLPNHPIPRSLIRGLGKPIVGTSANLSGAPAASTAEEAETQLGSAVDLVIDGGESSENRESTIVDITGASPVVLRHGIIAPEEFIAACREYLEANPDAHRYRL